MDKILHAKINGHTVPTADAHVSIPDVEAIINKACEWISNMPIEYSEFIEKGHCNWIAEDFRKAMETVTDCSALSWQDVARIADIIGHTNRLDKEG